MSDRQDDRVGGVRLSPRFHLRRPWGRALLLLAVLGFCSAAWRELRDVQRGGDLDRYHARSFRVLNVVDGDTIDLDVRDGDRSVTRVRLRGVDAPEAAGAYGGAMVFGDEASLFTRHALLGQEVYVVLDPVETRDRFGRLLAYVYRRRGGPSHNETLIHTGHAYADPRFDHAYLSRFAALEKDAMARRLGLWSAITADQMPQWRQHGNPPR